VDAPYVKEFPLILECRLLNAVEIGLHTQFIGEIVDVKAEGDVLEMTACPMIEKVRPIIFAPESWSYIIGIGENLGKGVYDRKRGSRSLRG